MGRLATRLTQKRFGWDDYTIVAALVRTIFPNLYSKNVFQASDAWLTCRTGRLRWLVVNREHGYVQLLLHHLTISVLTPMDSCRPRIRKTCNESDPNGNDASIEMVLRCPDPVQGRRRLVQDLVPLSVSAYIRRRTLSATVQDWDHIHRPVQYRLHLRHHFPMSPCYSHLGQNGQAPQVHR